MAFEVVMPRLSDSMEEGTILRWLKAQGEEVRRGEEIVEIESDKASMPYAADGEGFLEIVAKEGETLPVGAVIARLHEQSVTIGSGGVGEPADGGEVPVQAQAEPERSASRGDGKAAPEGVRVKASPLARRIAKERGIDLATLHGTGPEGRIVRADVEAAAATGPVQTTQGLRKEAQAPPGEPGGSSVRRQGNVHQLSRAQQVVARRMAESKATIPHFSLNCEVDMERCVDLRAKLKEQARGEAVPTYNDMLIKACALALREHPRLNSTYRDGALELHERVNIGVAVAAGLEEELSATLVVPTVPDADQASLGAIAAKTRELAQKVREGRITPPELSGATFTISNLGMFGIRWFSAIINPPHVAILAAGEVAQRPVVYKGELLARHRMELTLSLDHRAVYGAEGAMFLGRVRQLLEEPSGLVL